MAKRYVAFKADKLGNLIIIKRFRSIKGLKKSYPSAIRLQGGRKR